MCAGGMPVSMHKPVQACGGPGSIPDVFRSPPLFFETGSLTKPAALPFSWGSCPVVFRDSPFSANPLLKAGITDTYHHAQSFSWVLRIQTQVLKLGRHFTD